MGRAGLPVAVGCLMLVHQHEGLLLVAIVLEPGEGFVCDDICRVAGVRFGDWVAVVIGGNHRRVVVGALPLEDIVIIKPGGGAAEMPFADYRRGVAGFAQQFGKGLLRAVEGDAVAEEAIEMTVLAGEYHRPARAADGIADITFLEQHPFARDAVHVRRGVDLRAVRTNGVCRVVVGKDKENIRALVGARRNG